MGKKLCLFIHETLLRIVACIHVLEGHKDWITFVAFLPDCMRIVSSSSDRAFQIWDVETGNALGEPFQEDKDAVSCVAVSPDGKLFVSGSRDKTSQIWDMDTRNPVGIPIEDRASSVAFSLDTRFLVSGSYGATVRIWDAETGKPVGVGNTTGYDDPREIPRDRSRVRVRVTKS